MIDPIYNTCDVIDSRDIIERLVDLYGAELDYYDHAELVSLQAVNAEGAKTFAEWTYGTLLIRDSYFKEYAQTVAGYDDSLCEAWPYTHIDWDEAAEVLKQDYTPIEFDGVTYWVIG